MPATAMVTMRSFSPCLSLMGLLSAHSSAALRSVAIDLGLRLAPFGLPLWPRLNWYSLGGRPGPTLYSWSGVSVVAAGAASALRLLLFSSSMWVLRNQAAAGWARRRSAVVSKVSPDPARTADLPA